MRPPRLRFLQNETPSRRTSAGHWRRTSMTTSRPSGLPSDLRLSAGRRLRRRPVSRALHSIRWLQPACCIRQMSSLQTPANALLSMSNKANRSAITLADFYDRSSLVKLHLEGDSGRIEPISPDDAIENVTGYFSKIPHERSSVLVAYFALQRDGNGAAPSYDEGLFLYLDGRVIECDSMTRIRIGSRLLSRRFEVRHSSGYRFVLRYRWPIYKEVFQRLFGEPFNFVSSDFCFEIRQMAGHYRRPA